VVVAGFVEFVAVVMKLCGSCRGCCSCCGCGSCSCDTVCRDGAAGPGATVEDSKQAALGVASRVARCSLTTVGASGLSESTAKRPIHGRVPQVLFVEVAVSHGDDEVLGGAGLGLCHDGDQGEHEQQLDREQLHIPH